jgi:hypothetical protein
LDATQIDRALIQLFDNGETARQRYKLKTRINLHDKSDNPEFIAPMTKDFRNFKRYIPAEGREAVLEYATEIRKKIKAQFGSYPYIGKFHLNNGSGASIQVEPNTLAAVWYNAEEGGWSGVLMIQDWIYHFDLFKDYLTDKQKIIGVKAQTLYINPEHDKRVRPLTWAQRVKGRK